MIENFGRNIRFEPAAFWDPASEAELIEQLNERPSGPVRVVASGHAWSPLIETEGAAVSLRRLDSIQLIRHADGRVSAEIGAGCQIKQVLAELNRHGLTLPTLGLITEQRIAGAISTGTHGSGRSSLSHYVEAVRVVRFDPAAHAWVTETIDSGDALLAARCSLGCLGIITSVRMPCRPQYFIDEQWLGYATIEDVLSQLDEFPLQQFFLIPHRWTWIAQHRREAGGAVTRGPLAWLYRLYFHVTFDWGMHFAILLGARYLRSRSLTRLLCRTLPAFVIRGWTVRDRSDRQLVMEHELFRHLETELFVRESRVAEASRFVTAVLRVADGADSDAAAVFRERLEALGEWNRLAELRGRFTHHYPICFRRVLPDDTLISMTAGSDEPWQSISFITYVEPRDDFYAVMEFLGRTMAALFGARPHWGKQVPGDPARAADLYPQMDQFRALATQSDPVQRCQNAFTRAILGSTAAVR
jgi:hypothetical protein